MRRQLTDYRHFVWDWNGTLLDDTWLCCESLNCMLSDRGLPAVDPANYTRIFEFPVQRVYRKVGLLFDEAGFEAVSHEFVSTYESRKFECGLHDGALELIDALTLRGCSHSVLSAYESQLLNATLEGMQLSNRFRKICGGGDIHARSKAERARHHLADLQVQPDDTLYLGDTVHDLEAAQAMGVDCLLVAHGGQHRSRLEGHGVRVIDSFAELHEILGK
jgi:phosphoglycolate phosphatase